MLISFALMSRFDKIALAFAGLSFLALTAFGAHRTSNSQLISCPIALGFLVLLFASIARIFTGWRTRRWSALIPLAACGAAIVANLVLVPVIRQALFAWALPSYEQVVGDIQSGRIAISDKFSRIPEAESTARLTYGVFAERQPNGSLAVEFLTESGFPVKHSGYLYSSSDSIEKGTLVDSRWPIRRKLKEHWFYISD